MKVKDEPENCWKKFFESTIGEENAERLKEALNQKRPVYFIGQQGIGKSVTVEVLKLLGYNATEPGQKEFWENATGPTYVPEGIDAELFEMKQNAPETKIDFQKLVSFPEQLEKWIKSV